MFNKANFDSEENEAHDEESWLLTYADTITNLMGFFALLLGLSVMDASKFKQFTNAVKEQMTNEEVSNSMEDLRKQLDSVFVKQTAQGVIDINMDRSGIKMVAKNASFFNSGEASLLTDGRAIVETVTKKIKGIPDQFSIDVEGHTDDVPIKNERFPSNWELSSARASNVVKYMVNAGIDPTSIKASAFSDTRPAVPNKNPDGTPNRKNQAANRRIVIRIYY